MPRPVHSVYNDIFMRHPVANVLLSNFEPLFYEPATDWGDYLANIRSELPQAPRLRDQIQSSKPKEGTARETVEKLPWWTVGVGRITSAMIYFLHWS